MNIVLKIRLINRFRYGDEIEASTEVVCKASEAFKLFEKFFSCFDMAEEHCRFRHLFYTDVEIAPIFEASDYQLASELDENNPFCVDEFKKNFIWHIVNEWKYDMKKGGAVA